MEIPLKLRQNYIHRRQEDIISCETALKNSDFKTIEVIGHQMKGNGLSFGYSNIANLGSEMETAAQQKNVEQISSLLIRFSEVVSEITSK